MTFIFYMRIILSLFWPTLYNQPPRSTQPGLPCVGPVGRMSISQRVVMLCGWGVKACMVQMWVTGKTVWSTS